MKRYAFGAASFLALAVVCSLHAQDAMKESPYYPLKKDTTWTYKVTGSSITMKVTGHDKDGAKIETIVNNKSIASEHVVVKDDGIYRVSINGQKPDAPVKFFAIPPKDGTTWDVDTKIQGQAIKGKFTTSTEEVTVPAGKYKAVKVEGKDFDIAGMKTNITYWFAENVGIVKLTFSLGGMDATLELEKFDGAKGGGEAKPKEKDKNGK
jgi:hypothetical protein